MHKVEKVRDYFVNAGVTPRQTDMVSWRLPLSALTPRKVMSWQPTCVSRFLIKYKEWQGNMSAMILNVWGKDE
jgi:hypothetical protein